MIATLWLAVGWVVRVVGLVMIAGGVTVSACCVLDNWRHPEWEAIAMGAVVAACGCYLHRRAAGDTRRRRPEPSGFDVIGPTHKI